MKHNGFGFSMIELLVVIVILLVLMALGLASYSNSQKRARDAKRKADLKEIQNALEGYYAVNGQYPEGAYPDGIDGGNYFNNAVPTDPKCGGDYLGSLYSEESYKICADLESESGIDCGNLNCDYAVESLQ